MEDWGNLPGKLFVVSGPSGAGKSTLTRRLVQFPGIRARLSVSATTRAPRPGEQHGVDYFFVTLEEFEAIRARDELLEWAEVHGHYYGTPIEPVRALLAQSICALLVIDVQGGLQVRQRVPSAELVFIHAPSMDVLEARLRTRGTDDEATIQRRLANARREIDLAETHYSHEVINQDLDEAVAALVQVLMQHGCGGGSSHA
ncbi:MAG: guanylate kinase [Isosphaeraceae bacterium]